MKAKTGTNGEKYMFSVVGKFTSIFGVEGVVLVSDALKVVCQIRVERRSCSHGGPGKQASIM
jgi:hypothetical protein